MKWILAVHFFRFRFVFPPQLTRVSFTFGSLGKAITTGAKDGVLDAEVCVSAGTLAYFVSNGEPRVSPMTFMLLSLGRAVVHKMIPEKHKPRRPEEKQKGMRSNRVALARARICAGRSWDAELLVWHDFDCNVGKYLFYVGDLRNKYRRPRHQPTSNYEAMWQGFWTLLTCDVNVGELLVLEIPGISLTIDYLRLNYWLIT